VASRPLINHKSMNEKNITKIWAIGEDIVQSIVPINKVSEYLHSEQVTITKVPENSNESVIHSNSKRGAKVNNL
jgi:hypothetical protein